MSFSKLIILVMAVSSSAFSESRKTLTSSEPKYQVSQNEASSILENLKKQSLQDSTKKRPAANSPTEKASDEISFVSKSCWADENQFQEIQKNVLNPWLKSWKAKDQASFSKLLNKNAKVNAFGTKFSVEPQKIGNIDFYANWKQLSGKTDLTSYLNQFQKIDDLELATLKYSSTGDSRSNDLNMDRAELQIQFDLRAITTSGERRNDRGPIKVIVAKHDGVWKIEEVTNWGLETLVSRKPSFEDVTKVSGVEAVPEYQRLEAIRRGGYAIALGDVTGDGIEDLYLGSFGPGTFLTGTGKGTFEVKKDSGLEKDTLVKSAAFADFNDDGLNDLLLTRFVPTSGTTSSADYNNDILIYQNLGKGKFKKVESIIGQRSPAETAMPAAIGDFNGDGKLDFYVGFPGTRDFTVFGKIPEKEGVRAQGVYLNTGNFKFTENNLEAFSNLKKDKNEYGRIFPHSSVAFDFDQDGDTDIVVIDDRGHVSPAYQNVGDGKFIQAQENIGVVTSGYGMGLATADIDNNGVLDLVFSNVNFNNKFRMDSSCKQNWKYSGAAEQDHGLKLYYGMKKGQFANATMKNGLTYAGEGLAGVEFLDYNNDGYQDLYVANGLWTGTDRDQDMGHIFSRSEQSTENETLQEAKTETQSNIMKVLAGYVGDLFSKKKSTARPHLAGFQRNRLFLNKGDGSFIEVGYLENVDSLADGYVIAKGDIDNDGDMDLILRNGDPGTSAVNFPAVQVFKNQSQGTSLRLNLVSKDTKSAAIGASVTVTSGDMNQYQQLIGNNGAAQSETTLHFGLGQNKVADKIVITWPSKRKTTLLNVAPGMHTIKESSDALASGH